MITKENHEAIELLVASINPIQAKAEAAGLNCIVSITAYTVAIEARVSVYPGACEENITNSKINVESYDTATADLFRISTAIEQYKRANIEESALLEQRAKELTAELEGVESRLKLIRERDGKAEK